MKKIGLLLLLSVWVVSIHSQNIVKSLERDVPGQGRVAIHQEPGIEALLGTTNSGTTGQKVLKSFGYRIQIYAGNNSRIARNEAYGMASRAKEYFPDLKVYTSFTPPRWLCRVGDFRSIEEADAMMRQLKKTGVFKEASIVKEQVNIAL